MDKFKTNHSTLSPAYGRDYRSKKAMITDFNCNMDFLLHTPSRTIPINKEQIEKGTKLIFRFGKMTKVTNHTV